MKCIRTRIIYIALSALLILLPSCSNKGSDNSNEVVNNSIESSSAQPTSDDNTVPHNDYNGYEFKMISPYLYGDNDNFPVESMNGEVINDALYARDRAIEEEFNIKLNCKVIGSSSNEANSEVVSLLNSSVLAGDESYDAVIAPMMGTVSNMMTKGLLYDLKSVPYLTLDSNKWCKTIYDNMQLNDKLFFTTGIMLPHFYYTPYVIVYNIRLADSLSITGLYDTVLDGKWTFDKLTEYMKNISADINGDGKMGKEDLFAMSLDDVAGFGYYVSAGNKFTVFDDKGIPDLNNITDDKATSFIEKASAVLGDKTNVLRAEIFKQEDPVLKYSNTHFAKGLSLFNSTSMDGIIMSGRNIEDDYGIIPCPKYDESQETYYSFANPWVNSVIAVPLYCSNPERTGSILEAMADMSYKTVRPAVYDIMLKEKVARDESSKQILDIIYDNIYYDLNSAFDFGGSFSLIRKYTLGEASGSIVSGYEKIKNKAEKEIGELMEAIK